MPMILGRTLVQAAGPFSRIATSMLFVPRHQASLGDQFIERSWIIEHFFNVPKPVSYTHLTLPTKA